MKKLILILLFAAGVSLNTSAQVQKGAMLIGGAVNFNHSNNNDDNYINGQISGDYQVKGTNFKVVPSFGIFVGNLFEIGVGAGYRFNKWEISSTFDNNSSFSSNKERKIVVNPYISKYFNIGEKFYITGTFNIEVGLGKKQMVFDSQLDDKVVNDFKVFSLNINLTPGIRYFINKNWALSGNIGQIFYDSSINTMDTDTEDKPKESRSNFGISMALNTFNVGIQYYLHN